MIADPSKFLTVDEANESYRRSLLAEQFENESDSTEASEGDYYWSDSEDDDDDEI